ncbi:hypothetical protein RF11_11184 [Thelohanellus kitauei]|uniref:CID domain-containing protein n=1 Tax=Thelohanellus kitauei TaxID=669202 RepID=A0A0C2MZV2_THEKT|nr:hypothetical protein RF11_11184 [Thelohanellus kitauei]
MSEYRDSLLELLDSLSLAQVSIEQTSSFILSHPEELGQALEVWSEYLNRSFCCFNIENDDKLICLLYLANDLLQKIVEKEDRLNFGNIIMSNHKYFSSDQVRSVLIRLIKIWTERHLLSSEMLAKFQTLMDHLKTQQPVKYTVENLLSFLTVFEQTNNFIRNNIIQEHGEKCNAASMQSENANHENIRKWKEQKMQCVAVVGDIKNEIFHCRVQKSEFAALKQNFKNITEKVQKMITVRDIITIILCTHL